MTITVVSDPTFTPPKNTVTVSVGAGNIMSAVSVWRNDASGQSLLRSQPSAGFTSQTVVDYECPYGVATTYGWTATYSGLGTNVFDELWASTAAWTVGSGTWGVSGGRVSNTGGTTSHLVRSITNGLYRFTIGYLASTVASNARLALKGTGNTAVEFWADPTTHLVSGFYGPSAVAFSTTIDATQPFTLDFSASSIVITGTGGTSTVPMLRTGVDLIDLTAVTPSVLTVGEVKVTNYTSNVVLTETSAPVTLTPADAWLVHPATPALSFRVTEVDSTTATLTSLGAITNAANATNHSILGSSKPIVTTTGARASDTEEIGIRTYTTALELALSALLFDQTPILVNIPPAWNTGFAYGFYQVGDVQRAKSAEIGRHQLRDFTLPVTAVQPPVAAVQNTGWSYASLLSAKATYNAVKTGYATYANLLAGA